MIGLFNRFLNTWAARILFMVLLVALVAWGVGDMLRNLGGGTQLAEAGGQEITPQSFQTAYRRQLQQVQHMMGSTEPSTDLRRSIGDQVMDRLIFQASIAAEVARLRIMVPDEALRQATFAVPGFKDDKGNFSRDRFNAVLRNNDLNEAAFLDLLRGDLGQQALVDAVRAGAVAPDSLTAAVFGFRDERRVAQTVFLPFAGAADPAPPNDADLQRAYDNDPDTYTSPEYRHIKAVILSPETIAHNLTISDDDLHTAYDAHKAQYQTPERRSFQALVVADAAKAKALEDAWKAGADWAAMQAKAKAEGATAVQLDDATRDQIPSPQLAEAVFAAPADKISDPIAGTMGTTIARVSKITPAGDKTFDQAKDALRDEIARQRAADVIYDRADKVQDALASGAKMDELPGDLGLAAVSGTLDRQGITPEAEPAPLPATPPVKAALLTAAFAAQLNGQSQLVEVPGAQGTPASYYAVTVDKITPPARRAFDDVKIELRDDWMRDARRREQEVVAAKLLTSVKGGQSLKDAAALAALPTRASEPVVRPDPRNPQPSNGVPAALMRVLFSLKPQEGTMVETPDGFVVAQVIQVQTPDRASDPVGFGRTRDQLQAAMGNDLEVTYAAALRQRAKPRVNRQRMDSLITQAGS